MKFRTGVFLFLCLLGCTKRLAAQQPVYTNFTVENGLPSNEVYDIFEDSLGYMWFATDHGIARYDGYSFRSYSTADGLVHNTIFGFFEDAHHRVWMRTFNSALCYMENGQIFPYRHNKVLQQFLGRNFIQSFAIDAEGDLWFMSIRQPFGLYRQHHSDGHIERIPVPAGYNAVVKELGNGVTIAAVDFEHDTSGVSPQTGIQHTGNSWYFNIAGSTKSLGRCLVRWAWRSSGNFIFSFNESITVIANGTVSRQLNYSHSNPVNQLSCYGANSYWICQNGITRYNIAHPEEQTEQYFSRYSIHATKEDRRGNHWFATGNGGVLLVPGMEMIYHNQLAAKTGEILLAEKLNEVLLLFGRNGNLYHVGLKKGVPDSLVNDLGNEQRIHMIHALLADEPRNQMYLGNVKAINGPLMPLPDQFKTKTFLYGGLRSIALRGNLILSGSNTGWSVYDRAGRRLYDSGKENFTRFCTAVAIDRSGQYWIGTTDGLFVFRDNKTVPFHQEDSIFRQRVTDIVADTVTGTLYVSTRGAGLIIIRGEEFVNLREADGLTTDLCGHILIDDSVTWVCSNKGLNRIVLRSKGNKTEYDIRRITVFHGLPSNMINDIARSDNLILLATGKGLCWFDKHKTGTSKYTPPVYIEAAYANQQAITEQTRLKYNENNIAFSFIGLLFNTQGHVDYRYRLEGYDTAWNYTTERTIRYFNLPAGDYRFTVSAKNENGFWNEQPAGFAFHIPAHFSQTWWFRLLFALACLVVIWLIIRIYIQQRRIRERMTSDMLLAELKTLRSQMKPHFIFNSLNSIQHFILEHDDESAHLYLTHFSSLMRRILDNTRQNTITLATEAETLRLYLELEKLRFGENFRYTIEIAPGVNADAIEIPPMLLQPYAENAIWHGLLLQKNNPELKIMFSCEGRTLVCIVEDNGIGREKSRQMQKQRNHNSAGMKNIEERITILNRVSGAAITIQVEDLYNPGGTAAGTRVTIRLPFHYSIEHDIN